MWDINFFHGGREEGRASQGDELGIFVVMEGEGKREMKERQERRTAR